MSVAHTELTYHPTTSAVTVHVPAAQPSDVLVVIDFLYGESSVNKDLERLAPSAPSAWERIEYSNLTSSGALLTLHAAPWTPELGHNIPFTSDRPSRRLIGVVLLRGVSTDLAADLVVTNDVARAIGQSVYAYSFGVPAEGDLIFFGGVRFTSASSPGSTPMSTPLGMRRLVGYQEPGSLLRGVLAEALIQAGVTGERSTSWAPDSDGQGWAVMLYLPTVRGPDTRVRSSVSEDAGSLFQATQAVAVELGISEAFEYGTDVGSGLLAFREALTPDEVAVRYYAVPTRNQEMLATVEGETNLGRLAHTIAPRIFTRGTGIPGNDGGVVTAQQAIQHVVNRWQSEHPWLVFEPIPDLRLMVPEAVAAPRQHYLDHPDAGIITTSNVVIEQEGNERRSMREVLDEWTAIFPGTTLRQTSRGTIELVPRVGPDAPDGAALTLAWRDLARFSDGEDDPRGIYNRARVTSQGWEWSEDTPLAPPLFIFSAASNGLQRSVLESEEVMPSAREEAWPNSIITFAVLNDGTPVAVDLLITAFGSWSRTAASSFSIEGSAPHQFTLARGQRRDVSITHNTRGANVTSRWRFERLAAPGPDVLYVTPLNVEAGGWNIFGNTYVAYLLEFDVTGMAWTKSNEQVTSEFGQSGDHIPADGGGNALDQSRALYGERVATINSTVFQLDNVQARQVAESYVLHNINPRTVRDLQQSEWNRYPVKFDHIGRFVELPNGEVAVVENRAYSDSFAPRASAMMSTFTATVSHNVIDTSTQYLYNSDGSYWENDDGTLSEVL